MFGCKLGTKPATRVIDIAVHTTAAQETDADRHSCQMKQQANYMTHGYLRREAGRSLRS